MTASASIQRPYCLPGTASRTIVWVSPASPSCLDERRRQCGASGGYFQSRQARQIESFEQKFNSEVYAVRPMHSGHRPSNFGKARIVKASQAKSADARRIQGQAKANACAAEDLRISDPARGSARRIPVREISRTVAASCKVRTAGRRAFSICVELAPSNARRVSFSSRRNVSGRWR